MRGLRILLAGAAVAVALVPTAAYACQWEIYQKTTYTPAGPVQHPMARCVSP